MVSPQPRGVPGPSPGRSAACDAMFAAGRRRLGHLHGLKAKRLRLSVLFLAGSARQRSSVPPAGRAGRQAREDRAGRAGGRADGAPAERGYRRRAAASRAAERRRPRPPPRRLPGREERQGKAGSGLRRPPAAAAAPLGLAARCLAAPPLQPRRAGAVQMASPALELAQPPAEPPQPELAFTEAQKWIEVRPRDDRGPGVLSHRVAGTVGILFLAELRPGPPAGFSRFAGCGESGRRRRRGSSTPAQPARLWMVASPAHLSQT